MATEGGPVPNWTFLGACIRRDRKARRWTQGDLAGHSGLALRTIGKYERGEVGPAGEGVPSGYFAVGRALGWRHGAVEACLFGPYADTDTDNDAGTDTGTNTDDGTGRQPRSPAGVVTGSSARPSATPPTPGRDPLITAYRGVQDFLVIAVERGASPRLIRSFSDAAGDLLEAVAVGSGLGNALGLTADSPRGAPPSDDDAVRALAATADLPDIADAAVVPDHQDHR